MRKATIVVDLGFGDAGKGTIVDFLARNRDVAAVIRFNGGSQAAHNVVSPDGRHHTFSQFGSGTFVPGVRTHLSRFMLIDPMSMANEARHIAAIGCGNPFSMLSIDEDALVITPFQKAANRLRETLRDGGRHGSCGMGIGEATADSIAFPALAVRAQDLRDPPALLRKLRAIQEMKREEFKESLNDLGTNPVVGKEIPLLVDLQAPEFFAEEYERIGRLLSIVSGNYLKQLSLEGELVFEGAQGVLLDEWYGFHPYTTWSTTTFANAFALLHEVGYDGFIERLGVLRAYFTRHGPGPFPTEDLMLSSALPDVYNGTGRWQGTFRVGWFDEVLARYAIAVCGGVDTLAVTNLDLFAKIYARVMCTAYRIPTHAIVSSDEAVAWFKATANHLGYREVRELTPKSARTDLAHQEALTRFLGKVTPVYQSASVDDKQYLTSIEESLRVPVSIVSCGPTALEKQFVTRTAFANDAA